MKTNNSSMPNILAIMIIVISFCASYFYFIPNYRTTNEKLTTVGQKLDTAQSNLDALQKTKSDLDELGTTVDQILIAVPADLDTANFITEMEALMAKHGTYLPSIQLSANANGNIDLAFSASGSFAQMTALMKSVEGDIKVMNIKSMSVSSAKDIMTLSMQIEAFKR